MKSARRGSTRAHETGVRRSRRWPADEPSARRNCLGLHRDDEPGNLERAMSWDRVARLDQNVSEGCHRVLDQNPTRWSGGALAVAAPPRGRRALPVVSPVRLYPIARAGSLTSALPGRALENARRSGTTRRGRRTGTQLVRDPPADGRGCLCGVDGAVRRRQLGSVELSGVTGMHGADWRGSARAERGRPVAIAQ